MMNTVFLLALFSVVSLTQCTCIQHTGSPGNEAGDKDGCLVDDEACYYCWPQGPNGSLMSTCVPLSYFTCALNPQSISCSADGGIYECNSTKACFIATAAYGSPLHEKVQIFRDFRDEILLQSAVGEMMVDAYYRWSPGLARFIEHHWWAKLVARMFLSLLILVFRHPIISALSVLMVLAVA